jgi:hypothetical protein
VFSLKNKKCVKPNPYIQYLPQCKKLNLSLAKCKENYKLNIDDVKENACNYYRDNIENKINHKASCPKTRRPINDICPENYPILKNNKHNIKCCYKSINKPIAESKKTESKHTESKQTESKHTESKQTSSKQTESKQTESKQSSKQIESNHLQIVVRKNTPLNEFKMPNKEEYMNKKTKKYIRILKRYQNRLKPIK